MYSQLVMFPFVYLLKRDLDQVLEIKCDLLITDELDKKEKSKYLSVIFNVLENAEKAEAVDERYVTTRLVNAEDRSRIVERFEVVAAYRKASNKIFQVIGLVIFAVIFVVSYMFVFQPSYEAPEEEFTRGEGIYEVTSENSYILKGKNGDYFLVTEEETAPIKEESAELLKESGFEIIEQE